MASLEIPTCKDLIMKKSILFLYFLLTANQVFGQTKPCINDSIKYLMFIKALENNSTSPNFIVFKAVTLNSKKQREICQSGGYFISKTVGNNKARFLIGKNRLFSLIVLS